MITCFLIAYTLTLCHLSLLIQSVSYLYFVYNLNQIIHWIGTMREFRLVPPTISYAMVKQLMVVVAQTVNLL